MLWAAYGSTPLPHHIKRYKPTHLQHPMCLWTRKTAHNFAYATKVGLALCDEYSLRYGGKTHACEAALVWMKTHPPLVFGSCYAATTVLAQEDNPPHVSPLPLCMPPEFRGPSLVASYRTYYKVAKKASATWKHTPRPGWMN